MRFLSRLRCFMCLVRFYKDCSTPYEVLRVTESKEVTESTEAQGGKRKNVKYDDKTASQPTLIMDLKPLV